ncbi:hypothetical protein ACFQKF_04185 [Halalkalicoccus sp. GCM10025322]|uniref:hypothetical protein n=1 Tax=Halalkalicoccus TaxID=332246 RepID=UPI002F96A391
MRGPIDRRRVLGGIGAMITGSALAGSASGEEHGNDEESGSGNTLGTDGRRTTYEGTLNENDKRDTYSFEAVAGEGIELGMTVRNLAPGRDARMTLVDPDGTEIGELPTDNPNRGAYATNAEEPDLGNSVVGGDVAELTGGYCVRVTGADGTVTEPIEYELSIRIVKLDRFDPNEDRESATPLESGETVEGVIAGYDHDWFAVEANEGNEFTTDYEVVREVDLFDQALVLHTPGDETVEIDGSQATVTATESGTYYLHVGPDDQTTAADFLSKESYRLTIDVT